MPGWKFLTNHALVLTAIAKRSRITAREISITVGITEKATRNIISDLEAEGYVTKKREGRRIRYRIDPDLPLRHPTQEDTAIGELLETLGWKGRRRQTIRRQVETITSATSRGSTPYPQTNLPDGRQPPSEFPGLH